MDTPTQVRAALENLRAITGRDDLVVVIRMHIHDLTESLREQSQRADQLETELTRCYEAATRKAATEPRRFLYVWEKVGRLFRGGQ